MAKVEMPIYKKISCAFVTDIRKEAELVILIAEVGFILITDFEFFL
jgi:hypothetical protein